MTPEARREMEELKRRSEAIDEEGLGGVSDRMRRMMEYWKENRPRMYQKHLEQGTLEDLAKVREMDFIKQKSRAMTLGMPEDDATREAAPAMLMEPESEDFPPERDVNGNLLESLANEDPTEC